MRYEDLLFQEDDFEYQLIQAVVEWIKSYDNQSVVKKSIETLENREHVPSFIVDTILFEEVGMPIWYTDYHQHLSEMDFNEILKEIRS